MRTRGIALILATGILTLLAVLGTAVAGIARLVAAGRNGARAEAPIAAASGMEYAAARLFREGYPRHSTTPLDRGDDWSCREMSGPSGFPPPGAAKNPSYSHGESWTDDGDGRFSGPPGDAAGPDLDMDGRFSAWSGRLRGRVAHQTLFSLQILSAGSRLPVNAGFLDAEDRNGNGVADGRDLEPPLLLYHGGLAHALANLGAIVLPPAHPRALSIPSGNPAEPVRYSLLGEDLIRKRPLGGYPDAEAVRTALAPLGYAPADVEAILPYLDLGAPLAETPQAGPPWTERAEDAATSTPTAAVELATAPREVLEALWRYLSLPALLNGQWELGLPNQGYRSGYYFPLEAFDVLDPRATGLPSWQSTYKWTSFILYPDEAARLAQAAIAFRQGQDLRAAGWDLFYRHLLDQAASDDPVYPSEIPGDGRLFRSAFAGEAYPVAHARHAQMKTDLAFMALFPDPNPIPFDAPITWSGWGIPRWTGFSEADGSPQERPFVCQALWAQIRRIALPTPLVPGAAYAPGTFPFIAQGDKIAPLPLTLRPPGRFSVDSAGLAGGRISARARIQADLSVFQPLRFTSQEDFENMAELPDLVRQGILPVSDPVWAADGDAPDPLDTRRRKLMRDAQTGRAFRHVAALPQWDHASFRTDALPGPPDPRLYYSRFFGALALARREDRREAGLYWPFGERDIDTPDVFLPEGGDGTLLPGIMMEEPAWPEGWPILLWPPASVVSRNTTPAHVAAEEIRIEQGDLPSGIPGIPWGGPVTEATIEGWGAVGPEGFSPDSGFTLVCEGSDSFSISLSARRAVLPSGLPGLILDCWIAGPLDTIAFEGLEIPDDEASGGFYHFAIVASSVGSDTRFELFLDGTARAADTLEGGFQTGSEAFLFAGGISELRFHGQVLPAAKIAEIRQAGLFTRTGSYASPLYVLDRPARLGWARWTGITPPSWKDASGGPVDPFQVSVTAYADAAGTVPLWTATLESTGVLAELPFGAARAFRYTVILDASDAAVPLVDTPLFESIDLGLSGPGRGPGWSGWSAPH